MPNVSAYNLAAVGYVLTADLVREIAAGAALKPQRHRLFKLEDIAMGSWVEHVGRERRVKVHPPCSSRYLRPALDAMHEACAGGVRQGLRWLPAACLHQSKDGITPCASLSVSH